MRPRWWGVSPRRSGPSSLATRSRPDHGPPRKLDHWAIAGIPGEVLELFSKQSAEIDAAIEAEGFVFYRARGVAARAIRDPKTVDSPEALIVRWYDELAAIDWPARKINQQLRIVQDRQRRPLQSLTGPQLAELASDVIGPGGALADRKAFTRADVIRVVATRLYGYVAGELDRVATDVLHHPEAIPLVGRPGARGRA